MNEMEYYMAMKRNEEAFYVSHIMEMQKLSKSIC